MTAKSGGYWVAYTDGASRGNPGLAGVGVFVQSPNGETHRFKKFLGEKTNNQAEYEALILALIELNKLGAKQVQLMADSELMIKQMRGEYRVKNANLMPLFEQVQKLLRAFADVQFTHVRREKNKEADRLANFAIDSHFSS